METIELTQEQLEVELLDMMGWKCEVCGKTATEHFYKKEMPDDMKGMGIDYVWLNPHFHYCKDYKNQSHERIPQPTIEIAAAWELWKMRPEWADYALGFFGMHRVALFGTPLGGEYVEAVVAVDEEEQVPLAMSCAYYELLIGKRVVLVPALEREGEAP